MKTITYIGPLPSVLISGTNIIAIKNVAVEVPSAIAENLLKQSVWTEGGEKGPEQPTRKPSRQNDTRITVSAAYQATLEDGTIFVNAGSAEVPVSLPELPGAEGLVLTIVNLTPSSHPVELKGLGGEIEGPGLTPAFTQKLGASFAYSTITIEAEGGAWHVQ